MNHQQNVLTILEQKANDKRRTIYTVILVAFVLLALCASHFVAISVSYANGVAAGILAERELHRPNNVKPVDVLEGMPKIEREIARRWQKRLGAVGKEG